MQKIRKRGEIEKAVWQVLDKNAEMSNAWNDHGVGAQASIAAGAAVTEREFPAIAGAIHEAGFSTREYVVCYLTEQYGSWRQSAARRNSPEPTPRPSPAPPHS